MKQFNFVKPAALRFGSNYVSDHNRSPLAITFERIEDSVRTQNGSLRKYYRADKRSISCSWTDFPETDSDTVDFGLGAKDIEDFYLSNPGAFDVTITYDTGVTETIPMVFDSFTIDLESRRGTLNLYSVSLSLEEV